MRPRRIAVPLLVVAVILAGPPTAAFAEQTLTTIQADTHPRSGSARFEDQKMRFAINCEAAERARLRVSSKPLSLAKLVKDERNVGRN